MLRYAIILSPGWSALAWIVVATSGALVGDAVPSPTGPLLNRVVQIDGLDPCTRELIALDTHVVVNAATIVQAGLVHTDGVMNLTGWVATGPARDEHNIAVQQRFTASRAIPMGLLEPVEARLTVVDRPNLPVTVLAVRLQETWEDTDPELAVTGSYLGCA